MTGGSQKENQMEENKKIPIPKVQTAPKFLMVDPLVVALDFIVGILP